MHLSVDALEWISIFCCDEGQPRDITATGLGPEADGGVVRKLQHHELRSMQVGTSCLLAYLPSGLQREGKVERIKAEGKI
jgi:hypothetical protein